MIRTFWRICAVPSSFCLYWVAKWFQTCLTTDCPNKQNVLQCLIKYLLTFNFIKYDQTRRPNGKIFAGSQSNIWSCLVAKQFPFGQESFPSYFGTRNPATSQWNVFHVFYLHVYREMIHLQIYRLGCLVMVHLTHKTSQGWSSFHSYCNLFIYPLSCIVWWSQSLKWHPYLGVQALFGPRKLIYDRRTHMYLKQI